MHRSWKAALSVSAHSLCWWAPVGRGHILRPFLSESSESLGHRKTGSGHSGRQGHLPPIFPGGRSLPVPYGLFPTWSRAVPTEARTAPRAWNPPEGAPWACLTLEKWRGRTAVDAVEDSLPFFM